MIIAYLFLGGIAGGTYFVMAAWSFALHHRKAECPHHLRTAFKTLLGQTYLVALLVLILSMACLVWDLTRPERALLVITKLRPTLLTIGAFALTAQAIVGLALTLANSFELRVINGRARKAIEAISIPLSFCIMLYTGLFLASNTSIPFWNTPWLALLFLLSSLSSGISTVLLISYFAQEQMSLLHGAKPLQKLHVACLVLEAASLALFLQAGFANPNAYKSLALLMKPDILSVGFMGVVVLGIALPLLLEGYSLTRTKCRAIPFSDVTCLIGSFCLRWCVIMCGIH